MKRLFLAAFKAKGKKTLEKMETGKKVDVEFEKRASDYVITKVSSNFERKTP